jgi:signal transduction histidine kinase
MPRWVVCALAAVCVVPTIVVLRARGDVALAGPAPAAGVLSVAAGVLLVVVAALARRAGEIQPRLFAAAGAAWLAAEWVNPGAPGALIFTAGLVATGLALPLVLAAALHGARVGHGNRLAGAAVGAAAAAWLLQGPLVALVVDPRPAGCTDCPHDLLAVGSTALPLDRIGAWAVLVACCGAVAVSAVGARHAWEAGRPGVVAVVLPGAAFSAATGVGIWIALRGGAAAPGVRTAHLTAAGALIALAVGTGVRPLLVRRARRAVAAATTAMAGAADRALTRALASLIGDPALSIAYHVPTLGWLDASGRSVDLSNLGFEQRATVIADDGTPIAALLHRGELVPDEDLLAEAIAAARLRLDVERLQVAVLGRVEELRAARRRVVEASDDARRHAERDLHDGAQQRLVGLRFSLGLVQARADAAGMRDIFEQVALIDIEVERSLDALRELAHGLYPACLDTDGLAAAIHDAADRGTLVLSLGPLPARRLPADVERTAYRVIADALSVAQGRGASAARIEALDRDGRLVVRVEHDAPEGDGLTLARLSDRVAAVAGALHVERQAGRATITAELSCG